MLVSKIDDKDFKATNPGVWVSKMNNIWIEISLLVGKNTMMIQPN